MNLNVDINISIDELSRRIIEGKNELMKYVEHLMKIYDEVNTSELPNESEKIVLNLPNLFSITIYREPSKEAYKDLLSTALLFLKLKYAIYAVAEHRLGKLKGLGLKAMVRYFGDVPALVVINLDNSSRQ